MSIQYNTKGFNNERTIIVGIDTNKVFGNQYKIITFKMKDDNVGIDWKYEKRIVDEKTLINVIKMGGVVLNAALDSQGRLKGEPASLTRFEKSQLVIISELVTNNNKIVGYKVAMSNGSVKNIKLEELIAYGIRCEKSGLIPAQNAIFVSDSKDKRPYYKPYIDGQFLVENMPSSNKETFNNKLEKNIETDNNVEKEKNIDKAQYMRDIYTDEQLNELKIGKDKGINFRVYSNPALSVAQMQALREGLEEGLDVTPYSNPDYTALAMRCYNDEQVNGYDISSILSPRYSIEQLGQLSIAIEEGLDVSDMSNPDISVDEMSEIRIRLELGIYREMNVKQHKSWN